jgi:hypothetical protein
MTGIYHLRAITTSEDLGDCVLHAKFSNGRCSSLQTDQLISREASGRPQNKTRTRAISTRLNYLPAVHRQQSTRKFLTTAHQLFSLWPPSIILPLIMSSLLLLPARSRVGIYQNFGLMDLARATEGYFYRTSNFITKHSLHYSRMPMHLIKRSKEVGLKYTTRRSLLRLLQNLAPSQAPFTTLSITSHCRFGCFTACLVSSRAPNTLLTCSHKPTHHGWSRLYVYS